MGPNLYTYVGNTPTRWRDPFGLYDFWGPGDHYGPDYKEYTGTGKSVSVPSDWYIDINVTGGKEKGGTVGIQIGPSGVYVYGGVGYGTGGGVSITLNTGIPSSGPSVGGTISGGTGKLGGLVTGSFGDEGFSGSFGAGWGIGLGVAIAGTYTYPIWEWDSKPQEEKDKCK